MSGYFENKVAVVTGSGIRHRVWGLPSICFRGGAKVSIYGVM